MKISFVSVEDGITALGFRKMAALARSIHPATEVCYIPLTNAYNPIRFLMKPGQHDRIYSDADMGKIASHLAKADLVCFSSMTAYSDLTKEIIQLIKKTNPDTYILWGGIHPIVHPEDAIKYPDAICVGEGETAFKSFLSSFKRGGDYTSTKNFWFNINGQIIRNDFLPLHTAEEMGQFPYLLYFENELVYKQGKGFVQQNTGDYLSSYGLGNTYMTIWSIGCPYKCSYCANTKFIENDKNYRKIRHPSVDYIISEVKDVLKKHPHFSSVSFQDDSFMAIPLATLKKFAEKWKSEINIPFFVVGVIPSFVKREKVEVLVWGGLKRVRMGIQSGSDRILKFYDRPNKPGLIPHATSILADYTNYIIPPDYDLIIDNPVETREDVVDTLNLLYDLKLPFNLNIFALRAIPNTELANELMKRKIDITDIKTSYLIAAPTLANCMVYLLTVFKPPKKIFDYLLKHAKPFTEEQPHFPLLFFFSRALWLLKRAYYHIKFLDFSVFPGWVGWLYHHTGIPKLLRKKPPPAAWGPQS
jgi:radical SAM superfamily enzyme YgiQ (UPF0313 family)